MLSLKRSIVAAGEMPFGGATDEEILECVKRGSYEMDQPVWKNISAECRDLVTGLMEVDADKRLTVEAALQHKWIAGEGLGRSIDIGKRVVEPLREILTENATRSLSTTANCNINAKFLRNFRLKMQKEWRTTPENDDFLLQKRPFTVQLALLALDFPGTFLREIGCVLQVPGWKRMRLTRQSLVWSPVANCNLNANFFWNFLLKMQKYWRVVPGKW